MDIERFFKRYAPNFLIPALRIPRQWFYQFKGFNHELAQRGELKFWQEHLETDSFVEELIEETLQRKKKGRFEYPKYQYSRMRHFFPDREAYERFCQATRRARCLEIGSGAIGDLALMPWIGRRVLVDPLLHAYRAAQLKACGKTLFTQDMRMYSKEAEVFIPELQGEVDGFIFCTNTLDHCRDPWAVLENMGRYAAEGCLLLLWTDLWHVTGLNREHRNITKDAGALEKKVRASGFRIERAFSGVRTDGSTVEYGCVARKVV